MHENGSHQRQLTHLGGFATFPDFSPDGKTIIFGGTEGADEHTEIYAVDAKTGAGLQALTSCAGFVRGCFNDLPVWSPDGTKIAFMHGDDYDAVQDHPVNEQVWVMDANGGHPHPITTDGAPKDQVPDWSPDGSKIAYHAGDFGNGGIWVIDANGGHNHQLSGCVPESRRRAPGRRLGYRLVTGWHADRVPSRLRALGINDRPVNVMNADGSHLHRVTATPALDAVPAWQPKHRTWSLTAIRTRHRRSDPGWLASPGSPLSEA